MNYFDKMEVGNVILCVLVAILIVLLVVVIITLNNISKDTYSNLMSNYEIERQLKDIKNKMDKKE